MDFEKALKDKIRNEIKRDLNRFEPFFNKENNMSDTTKAVVGHFRDIIDTYYIRRYGSGNTEKDFELLEMGDEFVQLLTDEYLEKMYQEEEFSEDELLFIQYTELAHKWRGYRDANIGGKHAIVDILLKRIIMQRFGEDTVKRFVEIMEEEKTNPKMHSTCAHFLQLFSEYPYGESLQQDFASELEQRVNYFFDYKINCGGYALKIDTCVFPFGCKDFSKSVSTILDRFPFVRLLGDRKLGDEEYLVIYRSNDKNSGHHFIRVDDDGTVREKNGCKTPQVFEGWDNLEGCKEAIFAVKKEHEMFGYNLIDSNDKIGMNFEETITLAIMNRSNTFDYHGHKYSLKKSSDEEVFIISDGVVIAQVVTDGEESAVEIVEGKEEYVENLSGNIQPIIQNGHLINRGEFIQQKSGNGYDERDSK